MWKHLAGLTAAGPLKHAATWNRKSGVESESRGKCAAAVWGTLINHQDMAKSGRERREG